MVASLSLMLISHMLVLPSCIREELLCWQSKSVGSTYMQVCLRSTGQPLTAVHYPTGMTYMNARVGACPTA